jgi:hypothetical protein
LYDGQIFDIETKYIDYLMIFKAMIFSIICSILIGLMAGILTSLLFKKVRSLSHGNHGAIA